jgi:multicomponent K+:H+ antiporter subunit E
MKSLLPHPLLTAALLAMWLLLNDSVEPAHALLGLAMGVGGGLVYARLEPPAAKPRKLVRPVAELVGLVLLDVLQSNLAVLRIVAGAGRKRRKAGLLPIPLQLRDRRGLAVLACIVTATPGTSWALYDGDANVLTLHVLDLVDEAGWARQFKARYETRLMEIFP